MPRKTEQIHLSHDNMKFLLPHEIIARLDYFVATLPVDLSISVNEPGELEQQLEVLDGVLAHIELRLSKEPVSGDHALRQTTRYPSGFSRLPLRNITESLLRLMGRSDR